VGGGRRRGGREGGRADGERETVGYLLGALHRRGAVDAPCNFRAILWEFKNNSIRARGSLSEIC